MGRQALDVPLSLAADKLWAGMNERVNADVCYRQQGIMYIARKDKEMVKHESWLNSVKDLFLDSCLLSADEINQLVPGNQANWAGGIYTPSDGYAEPTLAASVTANAAIKKGAIVLENCAVRQLSLTSGAISGVVTEKGEIKCEQVLLAAGLWSRKFLNNHGITLLTLPLICSLLRTDSMDGPTNIAVGTPDFSFRKHISGGFIITQRGAVEAPLTLDHFLIGFKFMDNLRHEWKTLRLSLGKYFIEDFSLARHWKENEISPFEKKRIMDPPVNHQLNNEAMNNLKKIVAHF